MVKCVCILSYKHEILHKDAFGYMLFHIWVRGKLNYSNITIKSKMAAIGRFEGLYALVMFTYINPWSLNYAYYAKEVKIKDE